MTTVTLVDGANCDLTTSHTFGSTLRTFTGTLSRVGDTYNFTSGGSLSSNVLVAPTITSTTVAADNSTIAAVFSEAVFNATGGSGALETTDFTLSIIGGTATLASTTPSSIAPSGNTYTLGLSLTGTPNGSETLTVVPSSSTAIYDAADNAASTTQSNNSVTLNDQGVPTITGTTVAADNATIAVVFSEAVFNATGGSGALETTDFTLSIIGGTA
ncbi:MAG: hypothetical protein ABW166_10815, partial [Sedimenticola sp.]